MRRLVLQSMLLLPLVLGGCKPGDGAVEADSTDSAQYSFESGVQGWSSAGAPLAVSSSRKHVFSGKHSLEVSISGDAGTQTVSVSNPATPAGAAVTFRISCPSATSIQSVQPYVLQGAAGNWTWTGNWQAIGSLTLNGWTTLVVDVPADAAALAELGVQLDVDAGSATQSGIDRVGWPASTGGSDGGSGGFDGGSGGSGGLTLSIDMTKGPARQFGPPSTPTKISSYVYGVQTFAAVNAKTKYGILRAGGDAFTDWNWTNNYSNSAADYCFWQGAEDGGTGLAAAFTSGTGSIAFAEGVGAAFLATIPVGEHVSAQFDNNTGINNLCPASESSCNGGTQTGYSANSGNLDFVSVDPNSSAFVANKSTKGSTFCLCPPGQTCAGGCTIGSGTIYQDELVNYLKTNFGSASIFFSLDNEPNYWGSTHPEIWPHTGDVPCQDYTVTYDDIVSRDVDFATAIKNAWPQAKTFGPVVVQDGLVYAHSYGNDPHYPTEFLDYYLQQLAAKSSAAGVQLLDVLDVHYYNSSGDASQCVQNPRMFWDPNYTSLSASATDAIDFGWSGLNNYFDTNWYPRKIIPRLQSKIAAAYAANQPGLSFSEYNSGCETAIAGAVAQADNLGIFGREGVFSATAWPLQSTSNNYLVAAFDAYRNYDGNGSTVGDTAVSATTSDVTNTSVYAFAHSENANAIDLVIVNKSAAAVTPTISIANAPALSTATAYNIVDGSASVVAAAAAPSVDCASGSCSIGYSAPAMSVTTIIIR